MIKQTTEKALRYLDTRFTEPEMACGRCDRGMPATHRVESDIIKLDVCERCALEAAELPQKEPGRLFVSPLSAEAA